MVEVTTAGYIVLSLIVVAVLIVLILYFISKSKGSIKIQLNNYNYSPGDTIQGNVLLNLKKPTSSESVNITLSGIQKTTNPSTNSKGGMSTNTNYDTIFSFKQPLEGRKDYSIGEKKYTFKIKIPSDIKSKSINPVTETITKSFQFLSNSFSTIQWYLTAELETSGLNLKDKVQINIA